MVTTNFDVDGAVLAEDLKDSGFEGFLILRLEKAGGVSARKGFD
jgi:hypothetical protein